MYLLEIYLFTLGRIIYLISQGALFFKYVTANASCHRRAQPAVVMVTSNHLPPLFWNKPPLCQSFAKPHRQRIL